jgi:DNA mismatch repair protein MutH
MISLPTPPPLSEQELLLRCAALSGRTLGELAEACGIVLPENLQRHKGWTGQLLEQLLGADARSLPEPDFTRIGVEMKTIPVNRHGRPVESTYVCVVPLEAGLEARWEDTWLRRKLSRVLWLPIEADKDIPMGKRRVGKAVLWTPSPQQEAILRQDWEELSELICLGGLEQISARMGLALQIRPKAANSHSRCHSVGADGEPIRTNPRGFYLRPAFTAAILASPHGEG